MSADTSTDLLNARRATYARSLELRARARVAVTRVTQAVAHAGDAVYRARAVCATAWDGQLARWYARADRAAVLSYVQGRRAAGAPPVHPRGVVQARRRWRAVGAADATPGPHDHTPAHVGVWAQSGILAERRVLGRKGEVFIVREFDASDCPGPHTGPCLVFENHALVRRVWDYPCDWLGLSDVAVLALAGIDL